LVRKIYSRDYKEGNALKALDVISAAGIIISALLAFIVVIGILKFIIKKMKRTFSSSSHKTEPEVTTEVVTNEINLGDAYDGSDGRGMTGM